MDGEKLDSDDLDAIARRVAVVTSRTTIDNRVLIGADVVTERLWRVAL